MTCADCGRPAYEYGRGLCADHARRRYGPDWYAKGRQAERAARRTLAPEDLAPDGAERFGVDDPRDIPAMVGARDRFLEELAVRRPDADSVEAAARAAETQVRRERSGNGSELQIEANGWSSSVTLTLRVQVPRELLADVTGLAEAVQQATTNVERLDLFLQVAMEADKRDRSRKRPLTRRQQDLARAAAEQKASPTDPDVFPVGVQRRAVDFEDEVTRMVRDQERRRGT